MTQEPSTTQVLRAAADHLAQAGIESAGADARALAMYVSGLDQARLLARAAFPAQHLGAYWELIEKRAQRIPLQHLTGETGFRYLNLTVRHGVFVPRPETEVVAGEAIEFAAASAAAGASGGPVRIVDLCTGAGGIAIACATEVRSRVWAVDINPQAVELTEENAARNHAHVQVIHGDVQDPQLLADLAGTIDIVISNPPYIPFHAEPIDPEVREYDPAAALYGGGEDGLLVPRAVVQRAAELLRPGGLLVVEHGDEQGAAMRAIVAGQGSFEQIQTRVDLTNRDRMVRALRREVAD